jgi:hypothetical protein
MPNKNKNRSWFNIHLLGSTVVATPMNGPPKEYTAHQRCAIPGNYVRALNSKSAMQKFRNKGGVPAPEADAVIAPEPFLINRL